MLPFACSLLERSDEEEADQDEASSSDSSWMGSVSNKPPRGRESKDLNKVAPSYSEGYAVVSFSQSHAPAPDVTPSVVGNVDEAGPSSSASFVPPRKKMRGELGDRDVGASGRGTDAGAGAGAVTGGGEAFSPAKKTPAKALHFPAPRARCLACFRGDMGNGKEDGYKTRFRDRLQV